MAVGEKFFNAYFKAGSVSGLLFFMATITFRVATTSTSNTASYASASFTPAVGDLLIVLVVASGTVDASPTCTGSTDTTSFSFVKSAAKGTNADTLYAFVSNTLATSTTSRTVTFGCPNDSATGAIVAVYSVAGVTRTGAGAVRQSAISANQTAGGTPAVTFTAACLTSNPVLGMVGNGTSPATITPPTGWTENASADVGYSTPTTGQETATINSGFTSSTVTWGSTSASAFGALALEIDTSAITVIQRSTLSPLGTRMGTRAGGRI